jgi:hypothetical protein
VEELDAGVEYSGIALKDSEDIEDAVSMFTGGCCVAMLVEDVVEDPAVTARTPTAPFPGSRLPPSSTLYFKLHSPLSANHTAAPQFARV